MRVVIGVIIALVVHAAVLLFGGVIVDGREEAKPKVQQIDLLSEDDAAKAKDKEPPKPEERKTEKNDEVEADTERPPDAAEIIRNLEAPVNPAPALDAASLSAIEQALSGAPGGGEFADSLSFASGGRIGGVGKAGVSEEKLDGAFSLAEIDQKPRAVFQSAPGYPSELRSSKIEGVVAVIFIVDASGRVTNPRVEKSSHPAFERPALDAVKQWKFEPAIKGGERVGCRMRVPIRFQPS